MATFKDAYTDPREDKRDSGFLNHIQEVLEKWFQRRNGQREVVDMQVHMGLDRETGQLRNISIKASIRPNGLIV